MTRRTIAAAVCVAALLAAAAGCKGKRDEAAPERPPALSPEERKLGTDACGDYVARVCACAEQKPGLAEMCKLKKAKPEALALAIAVADDPAASADSVARAKAEVAKIVARCIEEAAALPGLGCP